MNFAAPHILWLLLVLPPAMIVFFWWSGRVRQRLLTQFIQERLLAELTVGVSVKRQRLRLAGLVVAVACLILALARPQWGFEWEETRQRGLDIVVAIDTSKSMLAEDIAPNRLARAKLAALDLMQQAKADRLGLVAFAGGAFLQCPLTVDDSAFRQSVEALDVHTIPQGGTAIAEAIETAQATFKEGDSHRALVLITDGEDHDSGAVEAAKRAAEAGMHIYTIGIGTPKGELLSIKDEKGRTDFIRDEQGNAVMSHLNEELLRQIAGATEGGFYLPLRGANTMDTLYDQGLSRLPKSEHEEKLIRHYHERYHWPLAIAIVLLTLELLMPERGRDPKVRAIAQGYGEARPNSPGNRPRRTRPALVASALAFLLLVFPLRVGASPSSALREYKDGNYDGALKDYKQLLQRKSDDPRLHFNAGASAYRDRKFDEAVKQFDDALNSPDLALQQRAYYNRGNTLFYLGAADPDQSKRSETWKKSVEDFQSALKLGPQDTDAKFNYEFVKKKLEELKQQQQQQQQNKSDKQQNQDQQQQNQQNQQNEKSKQDQQQQQNQQNQSGQKQDQQSQQSQKQDEQKQQQAQDQSQDKKEQQKQQHGQQKEQEQQQAEQSQGQPKEKSDEQSAEEAQASYAPGQMTPEQARQLMDAQKGDEMLLPAKPNVKPRDGSRPFKDW